MSKSATYTPCAVCGKPTRSAQGVCVRNPECRTEYHRRRESARPPRTEQNRKYDREHSAGKRARAQRYYYEHGGRETVLAYNEANKDKANARRRKSRKDNPGNWRVKDQRRKHGIFPEDWSRMFNNQQGRCYLCGDILNLSEVKYITIDHDHRCCTTNRSCSICRRGLACQNCNLAIGMLGEDPDRLRRMADALEKAKTDFEIRLINNEKIALF